MDLHEILEKISSQISLKSSSAVIIFLNAYNKFIIDSLGNATNFYDFYLSSMYNFMS